MIAPPAAAPRSLVRRPLLVVALALSAATACTRHAKTPAAAAMQFYTMLDALGVHGVPDATARTALAPFIGARLDSALARADAQRADALRRAPDEKPPFADGDVFGSLFEGRTAFRIATSLARGDTTLVVMALTNDNEKPPVQWQDTLVVVTERGHPVVADIRYGASWEFGYRGRLLEVLAR